MTNKFRTFAAHYLVFYGNSTIIHVQMLEDCLDNFDTRIVYIANMYKSVVSSEAMVAAE